MILLTASAFLQQYFSMTVVFFSLIGLSTVQIIAAASNMYLIYDGYSKRTWAIILGCCFSAIAFVPTFRHFRLLSILGVLTTTYGKFNKMSRYIHV